MEDLLDGIGAINHDRRLKFHAESTVEGMDAALAAKMAKAGFVKIEAGLQSVNRKTLRRIHRSFRPRQFLEGCRRLQEHGIEVMVDLIAGLPGDTLSDICSSMDWVVEQEAYDYLMLYPLSLMPSTEIRQRAGELGLVSMPRPPYLLTGGPGLTAEEMRQAFLYYEKCMKEEVSPLEIPLALCPDSKVFKHIHGLIHSVDWHTPEQVKVLEQVGRQTTYALTLRMSKEVLERESLWVQILKRYVERNPFSLISIEVPSDICPEEVGPLWQLARERQHPADRDYTVTHTPYRSFFLFSREKGLTWKWPDPRESFRLELADGQKVGCRPVCLVMSSEEEIPPWFIDHLGKRYPVPPEIRLWQSPGD